MQSIYGGDRSSVLCLVELFGSKWGKIETPLNYSLPFFLEALRGVKPTVGSIIWASVKVGDVKFCVIRANKLFTNIPIWGGDPVKAGFLYWLFNFHYESVYKSAPNQYNKGFNIIFITETRRYISK